MNVTETSAEGLVRQYRITVPAAEFTSYLLNEFFKFVELFLVAGDAVRRHSQHQGRKAGEQSEEEGDAHV